jgi:hypothetical protein
MNRFGQKFRMQENKFPVLPRISGRFLWDFGKIHSAKHIPLVMNYVT